MSRHRDEIYLRHMLQHAQAAIRLAAGRTRADLDADELLRYALIHLVCMTGEAGMRVFRSSQTTTSRDRMERCEGHEELAHSRIRYC
jgi:uncharacterized protein with HEPN domain